MRFLFALLVTSIFLFGCTQQPSPSPSPAALQCGGIAGLKCPEGYSCAYKENYPDAMGNCVKSTATPTSITSPTPEPPAISDDNGLEDAIKDLDELNETG